MTEAERKIYDAQYARTADEVADIFILEFAKGNEMTKLDFIPIFVNRYGSVEQVPAGVKEGVSSGIMRGREACDLL